MSQNPNSSTTQSDARRVEDKSDKNPMDDGDLTDTTDSESSAGVSLTNIQDIFNQHEPFPTLGQEEPTWAPELHNPSMTRDNKTGIHLGTSQDLPLNEQGVTLSLEKGLKLKKNELRPRIMTMFQFLDDHGHPKSVAEGFTDEMTYVVGVVGSGWGDWEPSCRLQAGWFQQDDQTRSEGMTELLWMKVKVTKIDAVPRPWFRNGETPTLNVFSDKADYVLVCPHPEYYQQFLGCVLPLHEFPDIDWDSDSLDWMDDVFFQRLKDDRQRMVSNAEIQVSAPPAPGLSSSQSRDLVTLGKIAQVESKLRDAIFDNDKKKVKALKASLGRYQKQLL